MNYKNLQPHPIADELPNLPEEEFAKLRDDIDENGLKEKIVVFEGMILDGRHRAQALFELDIPLDEDTVDEYDESVDGDPVKFVISRNVIRRHLTVGQLAGVALKLARLIAKESPKAKRGRPAEVDSEGYDIDPDDMPIREPKARGSATRAEENSSPIGANFPKTKKEIKQEAAKTTGASVRSIERLETIENQNPDLAREVKQGKKTLNQATRELNPEPKRTRTMVCLEEFERDIRQSKEDRGVFEVGSYTIAVAISAEARKKMESLGWTTYQIRGDTR